jgi:hypothetical protein
MTENDRKLLTGLNPDDPSTIELIKEVKTRPIPAIEKPLGLNRGALQIEQKTESTQIKVTLLDFISEEGLRNIGKAVNGRNPWEY